MKKVLLIMLVIIIEPLNIFPQNSLYISPGISISLSENSTINFGWKISLGYFENEKYYYNITFGKYFPIYTKNNTIKTNKYYSEIQLGDFYGVYPLSIGGGVGIVVEEDNIYPKVTAFGGALLFANLSYIFKRNIFDFGGVLVLPYPFNDEFRKPW